MKKAYLVLNGDYGHNYASYELQGKSPVYCVDGAYNKLKWVASEAVIGDLDSITSRDDIKVNIIHTPNQDYTDFEKALLYLKEYYDSIDVYCAEGIEIDHVLGNLSSALRFKDDLEITFRNEKQYYFFAEKTTILTGVKDKIISVMPFFHVSKLSYEGLMYPLNDASLELGGMTGIRNKAIDDTVRIDYEGGNIVIHVNK